jgi:hypothetical protein
MKIQFKTIGSLLGIAALLLVGVGVVPVNAINSGTDFTAVNDEISTVKNNSVIIDVFANDIGTPNEYTLGILFAPSHGNAVVIGDQGTYKIQYFPRTDYIGYDVFSYYACNEQGDCVSGDKYGRILVNVIEDNSVDSDGDGVSDSQERGDINGDGTLDKDQANVATINGGYVEVDSSCILRNVKDFTAKTLPSIAGLTASSVLSFDAEGCTTTEVKYNVTTGLSFDAVQIQKYGLNSTGTVGWFDFKNNVQLLGGSDTGNVLLSYTLTDGGLGDNGTDGKLVDPIVIYTNANIAQSGAPAGLIRTGGIF